MSKMTRTATFGSVLLLGMAGSALASDQSADIWHYLTHEGFVNTYPTLSISVHEGEATVMGQVDGAMEKRHIEQLLLKAPGVATVRNLMSSD